MPSPFSLESDTDGAVRGGRPGQTLDLVISFAEVDLPHAKTLEKHLRPLERNATFRVWHRKKLLGGDAQADAEKQLAAADVIVLLVSADYHDERSAEAAAAVARHGRGAHVVPVLVRAAVLTDEPYAHLVWLPRNGSAIASRRGRDQAWKVVVDELRDLAQALAAAAGRASVAAPEAQVRAAAARATSLSFQPAAESSTVGRERDVRASASFVAASEIARAPASPTVQPWRSEEPSTPSARRGPDPEEDVAIGRLPVPGEHFLGRDEELARLDASWADPGKRVVSIVAMGGAGKSALVYAWLQRMQEDGWRGAERVFGWSFYSQGSSTSSNTASGDTFIGEALRWFGDGETTVGSAWEKGERLARLVKQRRTLLVLDGLEPLQAPPGQDGGKIRDHGVAALVRDLAASGRGLCIISSRIAVADLAPREAGAAPKIDLDQLSAVDGASLLGALGAKGTKLELEDAARDMKGHALALTLLGSYLADACGGDVRKRKEIGPLEGDATGGAHARRVMDAYARWLGEGPELAVLRLLGLFDRPADEGCIRALRAAPAIPRLSETLVGMREARWNQTLAKLRRARLVAEASKEEPGVLDAHPLVREHFGNRLREAAPEAWREGHGRLFEHLQRVAPDLPEDTVAMAPLYSAVAHGCHAGRRQETLHEVLRRRVYRGNEAFNAKALGAFGAQLDMLAAFFEPPWTRVAPGLTETAEAFVLNSAGFALRALGRLDEATEPMRLALKNALARGDWKNAAIAASNLSELHLSRGAVADAVAAARHAVELADRSGDAIERSCDRSTLADALYQAGGIGEAAALFEEAEALQKESRPHYPLLNSRRGFSYCDLLLEQDQVENVVDRARSVLIIALRHRDLLSIALDHLSLGRAHLLLALRNPTTASGPAFATAWTELDQAVTGLRRAGAQHHLPRGLLARAELHRTTRDLSAAERDLDEALSIATRGGMRLHETDAHLGFARLHLARADHDAARASVAAAKTLINSTGYHRRDREVASLAAALESESGETPNQLRERSREDRIPRKEKKASDPKSSASSPAASGTSIPAPSSPAPTTATASPRPVPPMPPTFDFPPPVLDAYRAGKLAILCGSGLSMGVPGDFPAWGQLPERLLDQAAKQGLWTAKQIESKRTFFKEGHVSLEAMLAELDTLKTALGGVRKYRAALGSIFRPASGAHGEVHRAIAELDVAVLMTTNYDLLLEAASGPPARMAYTWQKADKALGDIQEGRKVLFKIHGTAEDDESIVMTRSEYDKAAAHVPYQRTLSHLLQSYTLLLVGYGMNDPLDLDLVFGLNTSTFDTASQTHYALMKDARPTDRDRWQRDMNVQVIPYDDHAALPTILRALRNPP